MAKIKDNEIKRIKIEPTAKINLVDLQNDLDEEILEQQYQKLSKQELILLLNNETNLTKVKIAKKILKTK